MMNWKKYLMSWVFKIVLVLFMVQTATAQDTPAFDKLKDRFEDQQVFVAEFSHLYVDSFTGERQSASGHIRIGEVHYKIEGPAQVMVVDGQISRVYDADKNRLIISDYIEEEDDFAPSRMLQGVDDTYRVQESKTGADETEIVLTSDDPFSVFISVTIRLGDNGLPYEIEAIDQAENLLITTFSGGRFTESSEDLFDISIPDDAEIIDLRHDAE